MLRIKLFRFLVEKLDLFNSIEVVVVLFTRSHNESYDWLQGGKFYSEDRPLTMGVPQASEIDPFL